jgi:hypothetical protein
MLIEGAGKVRGYIVTNNDGRWLAVDSRSASLRSYSWVDSMRDAYVFSDRWSARIACFTMGGYIVELT